MNSIKKNVSRDINYVLNYENDYSVKARFANLSFGHDEIGFDENYIENLKSKFVEQYGLNHNIPKFKWQSSFYDHIIRNEFDYVTHLKYIEDQWIKHNLKENKWCYIIGK